MEASGNAAFGRAVACIVHLVACAVVASARADPATEAQTHVRAGAEEPTADASTSTEAEAAAATEPQRPRLRASFAGGIAISIPFVDWDRPTASGARDGDLRFSVFRAGARATYGDISLEFQYLFFPRYNFLRNAVIAYHLHDLTLDIGVSRAPFGLLPFASNSWFFGLPFYVGLEDDADLGLRARYARNGFSAWLAFYKNTEGHYFGSSLDSARFSYDVVRATAAELTGSGISADRNDRETNELTARVAYERTVGSFGFEVGVSGRIGQLHDIATNAKSPRFAGALHARLSFHGLHLDLEGIAYRYSPHVAATDDPRLVVMGAFDFPYAVASRGTLLVANLSYEHEVHWGPIERIRYFFDTGQLWKRVGNFPTSRQLVLGAYAIAGPIFLSVDGGLGRNHPWIGPDYGPAFGAGVPGSRWHRWTNINLGFAY